MPARKKKWVARITTDKTTGKSMRLIRLVYDDSKYKDHGLDELGRSYRDEPINWESDFPEILRLGATLPIHEAHRLAVAALTPKTQNPTEVKEALERIALIDKAFKKGFTGQMQAKQLSMLSPDSIKEQRKAAALASGSDAYRRAISRNMHAGPEKAKEAADRNYLAAALKGMAGVSIGGDTEMRGMEPLANGFIKYASPSEMKDMRKAVDTGDLTEAIDLINGKVKRENWHQDPVKSNYLFAQQYNRIHSPTYEDDLAQQELERQEKRAKGNLFEMDNPTLHTGEKAYHEPAGNYSSFAGYTNPRSDLYGWAEEGRDASGGSLQMSDPEFLESINPRTGMPYYEDSSIPGATQYKNSKIDGTAYKPRMSGNDPILNTAMENRHPPLPEYQPVSGAVEGTLPPQDPKIENRVALNQLQQQPRFMPTYSTAALDAWTQNTPIGEFQEKAPEFISHGELISAPDFAQARHMASQSTSNIMYWWNNEASQLGYTPEQIKEGKAKAIADYRKETDALDVAFNWKPLRDKERETTHIPEPRKEAVIEGIPAPEGRADEESPLDRYEKYQEGVEEANRKRIHGNMEAAIGRELLNGKTLDQLTPEQKQFMIANDKVYKMNYKVASDNIENYWEPVQQSAQRLRAKIEDPANAGKILQDILSTDQDKADIESVQNYVDNQVMVSSHGFPTGEQDSWLSFVLPEEVGYGTQALLNKYEKYAYLSDKEKEKVTFSEEEQNILSNMEEDNDPRIMMIYKRFDKNKPIRDAEEKKRKEEAEKNALEGQTAQEEADKKSWQDNVKTYYNSGLSMEELERDLKSYEGKTDFYSVYVTSIISKKIEELKISNTIQG
jgi:hypothetical protein